MAALPSVVAPFLARPATAWAEYGMGRPPHGRGRPQGPYPGRIPSLRCLETRYRPNQSNSQCSTEPSQLSIVWHFTEGTRHWPKHSAVDALSLGLGGHLKQEFKIIGVIIFNKGRKLLFLLSFKWVYTQSYSSVVQQKRPVWHVTHV